MAVDEAAALRLSVLWARPFRWAFAAQTLTELADQVFLVALTWAVLGSDHGLQLGLVLTAWAAPRGIFLLFGGVFVDRADSRWLGATAGAVLAALDLTLALLYGMDATPLAVWLAAALVLGLVDGIRVPIGYSLIPLVVPKGDLLAANRWSQLRMWGVLTLGPPLGGLVVAAIAPTGAFVLAGCMYSGGAALMLALPSLRVEGRQAGTVGRELVDGLRFVRRHAQLRLMLPVFAAANLFVLGLTTVAIPLFVKLVLDAGAQGLGLLSGSFGFGLVVGTVAMGRFPRRTRETLAGLFVLFALSDAALAAVGLAPNLAVACMAFACSGFFIGPASTVYQATLQSTTPPEYLGRVSGLARGVSFGLEPVSASMIGGLTRVLSSATVLVVGGLAATAADGFAIVRGHRKDVAAQAAAASADMPVPASASAPAPAAT